MKIHPSLIRITVGNLVCCFPAFYWLNRMQRNDHDAIGINLALGWIFYLGIFAILAPLFLSEKTKSVLYRRPYFGGLIVFALVNIVIIMAGGVLMAIRFKPW